MTTAGAGRHRRPSAAAPHVVDGSAPGRDGLASTTIAEPPPLPLGFRIELDADACEVSPGVWFGGQPARVLRLTAGGRRAWTRLQHDGVVDATTGALARRLTDAGIAHPVPPAPVADPDVTVVIPVRDRAEELDRCLRSLGARYPVVVVDDASTDPDRTRRIARQHGARLVRLPVNAGPATARNAGLAAVDTGFVAFADSDTTPGDAWIADLAAHLADPAVAAVAPRITPDTGDTAAGRYTAARSSLDLGNRPARVVPYTPVSYVPTAALVARTAALRQVATAGEVFDPALRAGEDVDLVWRLVAEGWRVRYEPCVRVAHTEPTTWRELFTRRFRYGTSAAPLSRRHPASVAPLIIHPWYSAAVAALLARRPILATAAVAGAAITTHRTLTAAGVPNAVSPARTADGIRQTWLATGRAATQLAAPALALALVRGGTGTRLAAASLVLGPAVTSWRERRPRLDPVRFVAAAIADEVAYGAGVLAGCVTEHTIVPLRPITPSRARAN